MDNGQIKERLLKIGGVLVGYLIALLAACGAYYIRWIHTQGPDVQASPGMYAFGDALVFIFVFGIVALIPTGLALYFLRPFRRFWTVLSIADLALAFTGILSGAVYFLARSHSLSGSPLELWAAFAVLRMLATPLLAPAFLITAFLAPTWRSRWTLLGATAMEGIVGVYVFFLFYASLLRFY